MEKSFPRVEQPSAEHEPQAKGEREVYSEAQRASSERAKRKERQHFPGRSFRVSSARWVWGLTDVAVPHAGYFACRILAPSLVNAAGNQVCISARRALDPNDHGLRPFHHPVPFHH